MQSLTLEIVHICSLIQFSFGIFFYCERHFSKPTNFILFYIFKLKLVKQNDFFSKLTKNVNITFQRVCSNFRSLLKNLQPGNRCSLSLFNCDNYLP